MLCGDTGSKEGYNKIHYDASKNSAARVTYNPSKYDCNKGMIMRLEKMKLKHKINISSKCGLGLGSGWPLVQYNTGL